MYYVGLDVHKKTISYCVKDASGQIQSEGKVGATRRDLDAWMKALPQPWTVAMEATIFTGWIYDHVLPHAARVQVAHPLMLRSQPRRKTIGLTPVRSPIAYAAISCRSAIWHRARFGTVAVPCATGICSCGRWCR